MPIWALIHLTVRATNTKCFQYLNTTWRSPFKNNTMKTFKKVLQLIPFALLPLCGMAQTNYVAEKTIPLTGNGGYDYAFIDQANHVLYASHGTAVNVVDLQTEKQVAVIGNMKGVHGIAVVDALNRGFISDGKGSAVV